MRLVNITEAVENTNSRVKPFTGQRQYMATGDLSKNKINEMMAVDYETKPSRADLLVNAGQIILARMKATNKVLLIDQSSKDFIVSTGFITLTPKKGFNSGYLSHYFKSGFFQSQKDKYCTGATQKAINNTSLKKINVPYCSIDEQQKIAAILDQADALRKKRQESLRLLDAHLKSMFLEMFKKGTLNWKICKIKDIAENKKGSMRTGPFGSSLLHSEFVEEGIAVLGIDNAVENKFLWKERRYITKEKYSQLKQYTVRPGDIIITIMGTLGRSAVIPENIPLSINTKHLACITLSREIANPYFINYTFQSDPDVIRQLSGKKRGAIMDGLNLTIIKELDIKLPPLALQEKFVTILKKVEFQKDQMNKSLTEIDTLFNALSQRYFG